MLSLADLIHISLAQPPSTEIVKRGITSIGFKREPATAERAGGTCGGCGRVYDKYSSLWAHEQRCKGRVL